MVTIPAAQLQLLQMQQVYQGPIPQSQELAGYKSIDPTYPDRIIKMAESHTAADVKTKNRKSWAEMVTPIIGQTYTLFLGFGGMGVCIYLANKGFTAQGIAAVAVGFAPMVINAISSLVHGNPKKEQPPVPVPPNS
ncbi:hypothetical protein FACS189493_1450 [Spirochaetia bacterium]|nr:hypothetical protein FACS189493_1450 [Spirochaetia bacterium]